MKTKTKTRKHIRPESVRFDSSTRIDKARGVVKDVKILGLESRNGYSYSGGAARRAIPLYEGARVNIDHPERSKPGAARSYRDRFGILRNVRFVEGEGLRGNFHYNTKHPIAEQFAWDVENEPANCGFSHNAKGPLTDKGGGKLVCESIEAVRSVDLVADAATTNSLFEGLTRMKVSKRRKTAPRRITPEARNESRRSLIKRFGRELAVELIEAMDGDPTAVSPAAGAGDGDANVEALLALIRRVIADPNITAEETIKQVSKRLKALKDMIPGGSAKDAAAGAGDVAAEGVDDDDEDEDADEDDDTDLGRKRSKSRMESVEDGDDVESRLARLEAREERLAIAELCESVGFKPTEKQKKILTNLPDDETREALIESWQESTPAGKTAGKAKSKEFMEGGPRGGGKAGGEYKNPKEWAAGLKA